MTLDATSYVIGLSDGEMHADDVRHANKIQQIRTNRTIGDLEDGLNGLKRENLSLKEQNRQSRAQIAGYKTLARTLRTALQEVNPDHELVNPLKENPTLEKVYDDAVAREWERG